MGNSPKEKFGKKIEKQGWNIYLTTCSLRNSTSCTRRAFCLLNAANSLLTVALFLKKKEKKQGRGLTAKI